MGYASVLNTLKYYLWAFFIGVVFVGSAHSVSAAPSAPSISASCVGTGLSISMSSPGATYYALRVNNLANSWDNSCPSTGWPAGDVCGLTTSPFNHSYSFLGTVNYDVWAHACDGTGCSAGATHTFPSCSPPAVAPSVTTNSASGITQTSAVLNGTANANGTTGTATFMFVQSTAYSTCSGAWPWSSAVASGSSSISGTSPSNYSVTLGNISPGTAYSFCAVATNSAGTTYGAVKSFTTTASTTYTCSGTRPSNSSMWDSTTGLPYSSSYTYSSYNSSTQCEYYCNSGYTWNGSSCSAPTYTCSGTRPSNSSMWDSTTGLPYSSSYTYSSYNSSTQCEYYCNSGYTWNGSSCAVASCTNGANNPPSCNTCNSGYTWNGSSCAAPTYTCSGTRPSNTAMWDATSGLTTPASYTYSGSNTSAQCEYACASGYTLSGGSCVLATASVTNFKICLNSCTTGSPYSVPPTGGLTNFSLSSTASVTLCACSGATDCTTPTNTPVTSNWSFDDTQDAVNLSSTTGTCTTITPKTGAAGNSDIIKVIPTP